MPSGEEANAEFMALKNLGAEHLIKVDLGDKCSNDPDWFELLSFSYGEVDLSEATRLAVVEMTPEAAAA